MNELLRYRLGHLARQLAELLGARAPEDPLARGVRFLQDLAVPEPQSSSDEGCRLTRLATILGLSTLEQDLVVLAGIADFHEGIAAIFRALHPRGEPSPTVGLAAQILRFDERQRGELHELLEDGSLATAGIVELIPDESPFFERSLRLADSLWPVLAGHDWWPRSLPSPIRTATMAGLDEWLATSSVAAAIHAIANREPCTILVFADFDDVSFGRGLALVEAAGRSFAGFQASALNDPGALAALGAHCLVRDAVPVLHIQSREQAGAAAPPIPNFATWRDTVVLCCREGAVSLRSSRPVLSIYAPRLSTAMRRSMWETLLPELTTAQSRQLAIYAIEPAKAAELASDLRCVQRIRTTPLTSRDLTSALRSRVSVSQTAGVKIIRPRADWDQLVLPRQREQQLREAVDRLLYQERVFDEWKFLQGRAGARGVRMMFTGPPGTGKTFAAEVLAKSIGADLMVVDISRVVSKWVGETEKNLASVFEAAEYTQAVCFFDEADAFFGRRTEVSDAHDRYANLETAYLLSRLERFEGLAILATNLRQNIDPAFMRRLEFIVDFDEPDREERFRIWEKHIPDHGLLAQDVNLYEFAVLFPIAGGLIRNAAVAAAFTAASNGGTITRKGLFHAVRSEYHKSGRAFPGLPIGTHL